MAKKDEKQKSAKEAKKEIEDKTFGMKNKKKSRDLKKQIERINTTTVLEKKKKKEIEESLKQDLYQPKAPIGVDPKTIPCVYFINKICSKGDKCKYGHEKKPVIVINNEVIPEEPRSKLVCRFLVDAINEGHYLKDWKCPNLNCKDIHKLKEVGDVEISLEDFIELTRQTLGDDLTPLTEETFKKWKEQKKKEEEIHKKRVKALREGLSGADLFKERPDMFVDDEEAAEVDYKERFYENEEDDDINDRIENLKI